MREKSGEGKRRRGERGEGEVEVKEKVEEGVGKRGGRASSNKGRVQREEEEGVTNDSQ